MDNHLYAMLFSEDLVSYVLKKNGINWNARNASTGQHPLTNQSLKDRNRFTPEIGEAVFDIMIEQLERIQVSYAGMIRKGITSIDEFRYELAISSIMYLKKGYHEYSYLKLCALFIGVVQCYFKIDSDLGRTFASCVALMLSYIVNFSIYKNMFAPFKDWFRLAIVAQCIRRKIAQDRMYRNSTEHFSETEEQETAL
ncbi:hypothetical protein NPIL_344761 [Nephila pilipes]|uniref:Uncharacterized protein n=1 Tax=Nephila pilipes TaxID=299642 RepID=A0A8X6MSN0_NEPPI|nr:hypothetical protein NPIL_344761 [Nephila pilipes]